MTDPNQPIGEPEKLDDGGENAVGKGEGGVKPQLVNGAITDAVTQANVKVLGDSPAQSLSNLYQTVSQSLSLSVQNSVTMQQQSNIVHQATTTVGVNLLYTVGTAATSQATTETLESDTSDNLVNILGTVLALKDTNKG